jgi:glycosyltransferase involved in cell wall biosynthesis
MKVSIIIPCYNLGQYLDEAIKSVMNQTFTDWELIVIDDGSTDEETKKVLDKMKYPKTRLIRTKNQGLPVARNTAIKEAKGEYIACLDADDHYAPTFLEKTVAVLDQDKDKQLGIVTTWIQTYGVKEELWKTAEYDPILLATRNVLHVASLFRRECWEKVSGYSESLKIGYQDWDFWIKIVAAGYKWECIAEPLFHYQVREKSMVYFSNQKRPLLFKAIVENNYKFYQENFKKIIGRFFSIAEKYEDLTHQSLIQEDRITKKEVFIAELKAAKKIFTENLKQKQKYIDDLETSRNDFKKRINEKDHYINELEKVNKDLKLALKKFGISS